MNPNVNSTPCHYEESQVLGTTKQTHPLSRIANRASRIAIRASRIAIRVSRIAYRFSFLIPPFLFLIILPSCSPSKRLDRLIERHPGLVIPDTLVIRDTISISRVRADTTLHIDSLYEPVVMEKERLEVTILRQHDTLFVQGTCEADTIILEKQILVEKIKLVKSNYLEKLLKNLSWLLGIFIFLILALFILKRLL